MRLSRVGAPSVRKSGALRLGLGRDGRLAARGDRGAVVAGGASAHPAGGDRAGGRRDRGGLLLPRPAAGLRRPLAREPRRARPLAPTTVPARSASTRGGRPDIGVRAARRSTRPSRGRSSWLRALLALVVALALQVGVNYANDYSDGIRGTDDARVGPVRLVGQGLAPARQVKLAAFASFGVAALAGLALVLVTQRVVADPRRPRRDRGGLVLHRRPASLRLRRSRRAVRVRVLRPRRRRGLGVRPDPRDHLARGRGRRGVRGAVGRDPAGQQPARHPHRHRRRQAHPRRADGRPRHPDGLPARGRGAVPHGGRDRDPRPALGARSACWPCRSRCGRSASCARAPSAATSSRSSPAPAGCCWAMPSRSASASWSQTLTR